MAIMGQVETSRHYKVQRTKIPICICIIEKIFPESPQQTPHYNSFTRITHHKSVTGKRNGITMTGLQKCIAVWRKIDYYNKIIIFVLRRKRWKMTFCSPPSVFTILTHQFSIKYALPWYIHLFIYSTNAFAYCIPNTVLFYGKTKQKRIWSCS